MDGGFVLLREPIEWTLALPENFPSQFEALFGSNLISAAEHDRYHGLYPLSVAVEKMMGQRPPWGRSGWRPAESTGTCSRGWVSAPRLCAAAPGWCPRPILRASGMARREEHRSMFYDTALFPFTTILEQNWRAIRSELDELSAREFMDWPEHSLYGDHGGDVRFICLRPAAGRGLCTLPTDRGRGPANPRSHDGRVFSAGAGCSHRSTLWIRGIFGLRASRASRSRHS